jgi:hypothetical protein
MAVSAHTNAFHARYFSEAVSAFRPFFFFAFDKLTIAVLANHNKISDEAQRVLGLCVSL